MGLFIVLAVFVYFFYFKPIGWQIFATGLNDKAFAMLRFVLYKESKILNFKCYNLKNLQK